MKKKAKTGYDLNFDEALIKLSHDLGFASKDAQEALRFAGPPETLSMLPLIEEVNKISKTVEALLVARKVKH